MAWSDIFIPSGSQTASEQQSNYAAQQAELARRIQARQQAGTLSQAQQDFYSGNISELESQDAAAWSGFKEGAKEGLNNVTGTISDTIAGVIKSVWASIPWQLWLVAGVALFFWMGGLQLLKGRLNK